MIKNEYVLVRIDIFVMSFGFLNVYLHEKYKGVSKSVNEFGKIVYIDNILCVNLTNTRSRIATDNLYSKHDCQLC